MNVLQKLLTQRIEKLEADSKKLEQVREWCARVPYQATRPTLLVCLNELERILGTS